MPPWPLSVLSKAFALVSTGTPTSFLSHASLQQLLWCLTRGFVATTWRTRCCREAGAGAPGSGPLAPAGGPRGSRRQPCSSTRLSFHRWIQRCGTLLEGWGGRWVVLMARVCVLTGPAQGAASQYSGYQQGQGQQYGSYRASQTGPSAQQQRPYGYEQARFGDAFRRADPSCLWKRDKGFSYGREE